MKISVVIPVYKNYKIFLENLKENLKFLKRGEEIIVVDDYPASELKKELKNLPVVYFKTPKNLGFGGAVNYGIKRAEGDLILLLNSDVRLKDNSFYKLLNKFNDPLLFAVSFSQIDGKKKVGRNYLYWKNGFFYHKGISKFKNGYNSWAEGGAVLLSRKIFLKLGGFFQIYAPFYWEDIDLSYRAWKSGYKILFTIEVEVFHKHESTIGRYFKDTKIKLIAYRNSFYFIWLNLSDFDKIIEHCLFLPVNLIKMLLLDSISFASFFWALINIFRVLKLRRKSQKLNKLSDKEVLNIFKAEILEKR